MNVETKLGLDVFKIDKDAHIIIDQEICRSCEDKFCLYVCPGKLYTINRETGEMEVECSGCLECGSCRIACIHGALEWNYARGGFGIQYRFG